MKHGKSVSLNAWLEYSHWFPWARRILLSWPTFHSAAPDIRRRLHLYVFSMNKNALTDSWWAAKDEGTQSVPWHIYSEVNPTVSSGSYSKGTTSKFAVLNLPNCWALTPSHQKKYSSSSFSWNAVQNKCSDSFWQHHFWAASIFR